MGQVRVGPRQHAHDVGAEDKGLAEALGLSPGHEPTRGELPFDVSPGCGGPARAGPASAQAGVRQEPHMRPEPLLADLGTADLSPCRPRTPACAEQTPEDGSARTG